jgi:hypothetical protein
MRKAWRLFFCGCNDLHCKSSYGGSLDHRLRETSNRVRPISQILLFHVHPIILSRVAS